ncbi:hypothetical protein BSLG_009107 [Batrachochytrium salamandrivorans]|nr:hypothetical protein BSLG_009107 [Batrachochytrium salamandrivorans]
MHIVSTLAEETHHDEADRTDTESRFPRQRRSLCGVCMIQGSLYSCPRCNLEYCSMTCYKSELHADCTEAFYKANFLDELHSNKVNDSDRHRMLQMLDAHEQAELADQDTLDQEEGLNPLEDIADRFQDIDLDNTSTEDIISRLSPQEMERFNAILKNKEAALLLVPEWQPWWATTVRCSAITDMIPDEHNPIPKCVATKPISELTQVTPNPKLVFSILDTIVAYIYACHSLNGDIYESPSETLSCLFKSSYIFDVDCPRTFLYPSPIDAVSILSSRLSILCETPPSGVAFLLASACQLMLSRSFIAAALSDMYRVFAQVTSKHAKALSQKLLFLACLVNDNAVCVGLGVDELIQACSVCLRIEVDRLYAISKTTASAMPKAGEEQANATLDPARILIQEVL